MTPIHAHEHHRRLDTVQAGTAQALAQEIRELLARVKVTVNGRAKRMTALEAIFLQLVGHAARGHSRARRVLFQYRSLAVPPTPPTLDIAFIETPEPGGDDD